MLQTAWIFVGIVALIATVAAVVTEDNGIAIVAGALGFVCWLVVAYGALNIQVPTDSGVETFSVPELTFLSVAIACVPGFIALTGPVELVSRAKDGRIDEV